jgi:iron(III) transport system permease protein
MRLRAKAFSQARSWSPALGDILPLAIAVIAIVALLLLVAYPLAMVLVQAIFPRYPSLDSGPVAKEFVAGLSSPYLRTGLANSIQLGIGTALVAIVLATPAAILIDRSDVPMRGLFDFLLLLPFVTPPFLLAESWILVLQRHGYVQQLTGLDASGAQSFLYSFWGIVFILALHLFPLVYFAQRAGLTLVSSGVIEAAKTSGAGWWRTGSRILLPLILPATLAGALLVFAAAMAEYGAPAALAIQAHFFATSVNIGNLTSQYPTNRPLAASLSVVLMMATFLAVVLARKAISGGRYSGRSLTTTPVALGRARWPAFALLVLLVLFSAGIPWGAVAVTSVLRTLSGGLSRSNVSPVRVLTLLTQPGAVNAIRTSLELSAAAATAVAVLGTVVGYLVTRPTLRGRWLVDGIATLPIATPGIVIAVAVIVVWNQPFMPGAIYESQWVLAIAYTIVFLPFGVRYASSAFQAMPPGLDEAGRTSGAGIVRRMYRLILPLVIPAVLSAWALAFAIGMRELENSLIVRPPGTVTISYFMWQSFTQGNPLSGMAMAVLTLLVTSIALLVVRSLVGRASALTV